MSYIEILSKKKNPNVTCIQKLNLEFECYFYSKTYSLFVVEVIFFFFLVMQKISPVKPNQFKPFILTRDSVKSNNYISYHTIYLCLHQKPIDVLI